MHTFFSFAVSLAMAASLLAPAQLAIAVQNDSKALAKPETDSGSDSDSGSNASAAISFGEASTNRWRVGAQLLGGTRSCKNLLVTIPVPTDWPEQEVRLHKENFPPEIRSADYRDLNSGVRQLVVEIPKLKAKQLIEFTVTFDVSTRRIVAPENTAQLKIPQRPPREFKDYVGVSPQISYRNSKLRNKVKEIIKQEENAWDQVEAIFDWVRDNIQYRNDEPTDSLSVFRKKSGCSEDLVGLFVAMCRAAKIPARMVWVEGAQFAEFYLVDAKEKGHWYPCQVAGRREFGSNAEPRIILQKGDNIKVPEKDGRQKFCAEFLSVRGTQPPRAHKFLRDLLPVD